MKIYIISRDSLSSFLEEKGIVNSANISDELFKEACKESGWTMTLEEYQKSFNDETDLDIPRYDYHYIRFME